MTRRLLRPGLRFRWLVIFAAVALMVFGIGETRNAPEDVFPEFAPPRAEIQRIEDAAGKRPVNADLLTMLLLVASCLGAGLRWLFTQTQRQRVIRFLVVRPSLASAGTAPPSLGVFRL